MCRTEDIVPFDRVPVENYSKFDRHRHEPLLVAFPSYFDKVGRAKIQHLQQPKPGIQHHARGNVAAGLVSSAWLETNQSADLLGGEGRNDLCSYLRSWTFGFVFSHCSAYSQFRYALTQVR